MPELLPDKLPEKRHLTLFIDDNADDFEAVQRSFKRNHCATPLHWCSSAKDALDFLHCRGKYDAMTTVHPALILLDLNMPGMDGRDFLREIKADNGLRSIPVIIFSTSNDPKDVRECYLIGANSYIQKPVEFSDLKKAMQTMTDYWLNVALPPEKEAHHHG